MSRSAIALTPSWRDYWGMWNPLVEPWIAPIERSVCHAPRFAVLPQQAQWVVPAGGKVEYNFHLVPGSLIFALFPFPGLTFNQVTIQLTDVSLGYQFFQEPISTDQFQVTAANSGYFPSPTLLPTPHPVVGDGLFSFEAWAAPGTVFALVLGVAEVTDCPVR